MNDGRSTPPGTKAPTATVSAVASAAGALDNLVTQFSNAFDCFRELAQNSIDAGSPVVEIWTEFDVARGQVGVACLHVDDWGDGMDERIIDHELTKLFASSKEGDLTKIGKFGIGFVSVFALKPSAVLLHTGRGGEYWEVLFHEDRSFSKTRLAEPVEGTRITLFVEADHQRYGELVAGTRAALKKWCCHAEAQVRFEDRSPAPGRPRVVETINEPFTVEGACLTRVEAPGTELVLAYHDRPRYAFFNRGLALASTDVGAQVLDERRARRYRRISFKIGSRYVEHTLSRESVMRDENYDRVIALLDEAAAGPLLDRLVAELEALAGRPPGESWSAEDLARYGERIGWLLAEPASSLDRIAERRVLRTVQDAALSLADAWDAFGRDGRLLAAAQTTPLTARLAADGVPVFLAGLGESRGETLAEDAETGHPVRGVPALLAGYARLRRHRRFGTKAREVVKAVLPDEWTTWLGPEAPPEVADPERVFVSVALDHEVPEALEALLASAGDLLRSAKAGYRRLHSFTPSAPTLDDPLFVTGRRLGPRMARPPRDVPDRRRRLEAAVNRAHPHLVRLLRLHERRPALAAYCLARGLLLAERRVDAQKGDLLGRALRELGA
ncbi:MAG: ATP-binding protein [Deltaproteobacteria bacterium]|nr:ATP-binding protein [Deltaproteobacteria bacterium]